MPCRIAKCDNAAAACHPARLSSSATVQLHCQWTVLPSICLQGHIARRAIAWRGHRFAPRRRTRRAREWPLLSRCTTPRTAASRVQRHRSPAETPHRTERHSLLQRGPAICCDGANRIGVRRVVSGPRRLSRWQMHVPRRHPPARSPMSAVGVCVCWLSVCYLLLCITCGCRPCCTPR